ncbi:hypothetical protein CSA56_03435 [candidate division KSB3 bacterium]|uniref:Uncharacterized protein n=1 Tax=candidate division KSB3 bacterium TaxID=2044937 RepID=A0A2G6KIW4_9BACT|nr:MAG: hypothetical protein CSA56_03435 [candidate division KSB3 bacterium]
MMMKTTSQNAGISERKRKRLKKRIEKSLSGLRSDRTNYRLHIELGDLYSIIEQAQDAEKHYSNAIGILHEKQIDDRIRKQIIMLYGKILNLVPEKRETYSALGREYVAAGQKEKAARFLLSSAKRAFENNDNELALQCYTDVIELGKSNPYIIERCTEIFLKLGRKDDAVKNYIHIGDTYAHDEKYIEALDYYKKADALQPEIPELTLKVARMYYALEWTENAATELVKLAEYYEERHDYPEATKYYQHSLSLDQDNEKAKNGKQRILELNAVEPPEQPEVANQDTQHHDILDELDRLEDFLKDQDRTKEHEDSSGETPNLPHIQDENVVDASVNDLPIASEHRQEDLYIIEAPELALQTANTHENFSNGNGHVLLQAVEHVQEDIENRDSKEFEVSWQDRLMDLNLEKDFVLETGLEEAASTGSRAEGLVAPLDDILQENTPDDSTDSVDVGEPGVSFAFDDDLQEGTGSELPLNIDEHRDADAVTFQFEGDSQEGDENKASLSHEADSEDDHSVGVGSGESIDTGWIGEHSPEDIETEATGTEKDTTDYSQLDHEAEEFVEEFVRSTTEGTSEFVPSPDNEPALSEPQVVQDLENAPFEPEQIAIDEFSELERAAEPIEDTSNNASLPIAGEGTLKTEEFVVTDCEESSGGQQAVVVSEDSGAEAEHGGEDVVAEPVLEENPEIEIGPDVSGQSSVFPEGREDLSQNGAFYGAEKFEELKKQLENTKEEKHYLQEQFTTQIGELRSREILVKREFELAQKEKEDLQLRLDEMTATYEVSRHHAEEFDEARYEAIISKIQNKKSALQQYLNRLRERRDENGKFMAAELQHLGETKQRLQHNLEYIQQVKTRIEEKITTELREAQQQIRTLTQSSQQLEDQVKARERTESNLRKQLVTVKDERDVLQDQFTETISALTADNEKLGERVKELTTKQSDTEKTLKKKFQTLHMSYQQLKSEYRNSLESKEAELTRTAQRLSEFADEYVKLEKTLGEIRQERDKLGKMLAKETATRERLEDKLLNIESQVDSLEVQGTELLDQLGEELDRQLNLKQSTSEEFQDSLEDFEQLLSLQEREIQSLEAL